MKRTLTAAVALAATMGMAGLAMAQGTAPGAPTTTPQNPGMSPASPSTGTPGMTTGSSGNYQQPGALGNNQAMQGQPGTSPSGQQTSPASIQQAQQKLKSQGLYNGAIDGIVGPGTQSALMQFQRSQGLPETAQLDAQTLGRLSGQNTGANGGTTQNMGGANTGPAYPAGTQNPAAAGSR